MKFNHYYEELGLTEYNFPFEKDEDKEGFSETEFFNLDYSLALYIYGRLRYFQDHCLVGSPSYMTFEQWSDIINKIIKGFYLYLTEDYKLSKNKEKQMKYGMKLFIKYFPGLWY